MSKKHKKLKKTKKAKHRNAAPMASSSSGPRRSYRPRRGKRPDMGMTVASAAGGGGGALLGGFLANQGWDPEMVALAMAVGGGVGAYTLDGNWRIAANGLAAAGAGQLALALMADREAKKAEKEAATAPKAEPKKPANARFSGLDRAFNRVRERVQGVYDDEDDDRFLDDAA